MTVNWTMNHKDIYKADSLKSDQTVTDRYYTDDQLRPESYTIMHGPYMLQK